MIKENTKEHREGALDKHRKFEHILKDGSKIVTIDKTYCSVCPFIEYNKSPSGWTCMKFPKRNDSQLGDWYDGPLRRIECMKQTGDWNEN